MTAKSRHAPIAAKTTVLSATTVRAGLFGPIGLSQDSLLVLRREDPALGNGDDLRVGAVGDPLIAGGRAAFVLASLGLTALYGQDRRGCLRVLHAACRSRPALQLRIREVSQLYWHGGLERLQYCGVLKIQTNFTAHVSLAGAASRNIYLKEWTVR